MRTLALCLAASTLMLGSAGAASAAPCRDAKGNFAKFPKAPAKPVKCKTAQGKFAKCGTPGAKPI